jgi:hypothetical protein
VTRHSVRTERWATLSRENGLVHPGASDRDLIPILQPGAAAMRGEAAYGIVYAPDSKVAPAVKRDLRRAGPDIVTGRTAVLFQKRDGFYHHGAV